MSSADKSTAVDTDNSWVSRLVQHRHFTRIWRTICVAFALYMFALISAYIFVSGRTVDFAYTVTGQDVVASSSQLSWRVGVRELSHARFLRKAEVAVSYEDALGKEERLYLGHTSSAGFADVNLRIPALPEGNMSFKVKVTPRGQPAASVKVPVSVIASRPPDLVKLWGDAASQNSERATKAKEVFRVHNKGGELPPEGVGPIKLEMIGDGGVPTDGLRSTVFIRTTDRESGQPISATVTLTLKKGMLEGEAPAEVKTDGAGLAYVELTPIGSQRWHLEVKAKEEGETKSAREFVLKSKRKQYSLRLKAPIWESGEDFQANVLTLHRKGALYGDLVLDGRVLYGEVSGIGVEGGGFLFGAQRVPRPLRGVWLLKLQVYGHALAPGSAADVRYVAVPADGMATRDVLRAILERAWGAGVAPDEAQALLRSRWLKTAPRQELHAQLTFWLSRLPHPLTAPELRLDTRAEDSAKLAQETQSYRDSFMVLLVVSGTVALAIILYLVVFNLVVVRVRSRQVMSELMVDLEGSEADDSVVAKGGLARTQALFQLVIIFVTILLFFVALLVLLQKL